MDAPTVPLEKLPLWHGGQGEPRCVCCSVSGPVDINILEVWFYIAKAFTFIPRWTG